MRSFAKTKCPKCGRITLHHLGNYGFFGNEITTCSCGYQYRSIPNCIESEVSYPPQQKSSRRSLAQFTTKELERELKKRKR